jgi:Ribbon-helix-helix protein, copG family
MTNTAKITVTVSHKTLSAVEKRRRALGASRSAIVTAALELWLADQSMTPEERKYILGYLRQPETKAEMRDAGALAVAAVSTWEPWKAHRPRVRRSRGAG